MELMSQGDDGCIFITASPGGSCGGADTVGIDVWCGPCLCHVLGGGRCGGSTRLDPETLVPSRRRT